MSRSAGQESGRNVWRGGRGYWLQGLKKGWLSKRGGAAGLR